MNACRIADAIQYLMQSKDRKNIILNKQEKDLSY